MFSRTTSSTRETVCRSSQKLRHDATPSRGATQSRAREALDGWYSAQQEGRACDDHSAPQCKWFSGRGDERAHFLSAARPLTRSTNVL